MRVRTGRLVWLLALGMFGQAALARAQEPPSPLGGDVDLFPFVPRGQGPFPYLARGQEPNNYEVPPPDPMLPLPLGMPRYEDGGFFFAGEFLYMMQTNPIGSQFIAFRGFFDLDGSASGLTPGSFVGSRDPALNANQVSGPASYQPGFTVNLGYRFQNGTVLSLNWWHLMDVKYSATASVVPQSFTFGTNLSDSFISSPVFNFPIEFAGPPSDLSVGNKGNTFGIWNAASLMTIDFIQRFDKVDLTGRFPVWENETWRTYALFGGRAVVMWERFKWRTVDFPVNQIPIPLDVANYTNVISQRMYGLHIGCGNDWYMGSTPLGAL